VVTLLNNSARARLPGCGVNPLFEGESTIAADVAVLDDPGNTITSVAVSLGPENSGGSLCGATTGDVGADGVAHFSLGVDLGVPPPTCAALGSCTYQLTATAEGAESGVSQEFTITVVVVT